MGRRRSKGTTSDTSPPLEADMRKRFLVLASVATMALAGTAMPAFADSGTAATTTTTSSLVSVTCSFDPIVTIPGTTFTLDKYTVRVSPQVAMYLVSSTPRTVTYGTITTKIT